MQSDYVAYTSPTSGKRWGVLGFLVALALLYVLFVALPLQFETAMAFLVVLGITFVAGFISRKGKRGALVGFFLLFLPLLLLGILLFVIGLGVGYESYGEGVPRIVHGLAEGMAGLALLGAGLALIIGSFIAGALGALGGGLGGWISGKAFPVGGREEYPPSPPSEEYY